MEFSNTVSVKDAMIATELKKLVPELVRNGFRIIYRNDPDNPNTVQSSIYIVKNENVGGIEYSILLPFGYQVVFLVETDDGEESAVSTVPNVVNGHDDLFVSDIATLLQAADLAVKPEIESWRTGTVYRNAGLKILESLKNHTEVVCD